MAKSELTNGVPAEVVMEITTNQNDEYSRHLYEDKGRVVEMNGNYYIRYEEKQDDGRIPVTVKILPNGEVTLIRQGEVATRLTFDSVQNTYTQYKTPAGTVQLKVVTTDLKVSYYDRPFAGRVHVDYSLYMGDEPLGSFQIRLRFTT